MIDNLHEWVKGYGLKDEYYQQMIDCSSIPLSESLTELFSSRNFLHIFLTTDVKPGPNPCTKPKNYGFTKGRGCIAIKLNRVFGWIPEPYQSKEEVPLRNS